MILRKSETVLRLLVALALGAGFIGFATQGRAEPLENSHGAPHAMAHVDR